MRKPSIMQTEKECYHFHTTGRLHLHHIYYGTGQRKISEENGFWCWLIPELHNMSDEGVHGKNGHVFDLALKRECQRKFEETHTREEFMKLIGRNYLDV